MKLIISLLLFVLVCVIINAQQCPRIIPHTQWAVRRPRNPEAIQQFPQPPTLVAIHHSNGPSCRNHGACSQQLRSLQATHFREGYNDINANFVIGDFNIVYEGRGWGVQGQTNPSFDARVLNIVFIGSFHNVLPSQRQYELMAALLRCGIAKGVISPKVQFVAHRQLRESHCPGAALYHHMTSWPRFNRNPV